MNRSIEYRLLFLPQLSAVTNLPTISFSKHINGLLTSVLFPHTLQLLLRSPEWCRNEDPARQCLISTL